MAWNRFTFGLSVAFVVLLAAAVFALSIWVTVLETEKAQKVVDLNREEALVLEQEIAQEDEEASDESAEEEFITSEKTAEVAVIGGAGLEEETVLDVVVTTVSDAGKKVAEFVRRRLARARGTVVSYRAPLECSVSKKPGVLTMSIGEGRYLVFRMPCGTRVTDVRAQVGSTVVVGYDLDSCMNHVCNANILLRDQTIGNTSTLQGQSSAGDCPLCGISEGGSGGY